MMTAGYAYDETETTTIVTILHPYLGGHKLFIYPLAGKKKRSEKIHQLQVCNKKLGLPLTNVRNACMNKVMVYVEGEKVKGLHCIRIWIGMLILPTVPHLVSSGSPVQWYGIGLI